MSDNTGVPDETIDWLRRLIEAASKPDGTQQVYGTMLVVGPTPIVTYPSTQIGSIATRADAELLTAAASLLPNLLAERELFAAQQKLLEAKITRFELLVHGCRQRRVHESWPALAPLLACTDPDCTTCKGGE